MKVKSDEAYEFLLEAANMMKKDNTGKAIELYDKVCEGYCF